MPRPPSSSPPSFPRALVVAPTGVRASKPLPLVHITSSAPSISSLALRREFLLPSPSRSSGRNWPVVVLAAPRHQHEDDARDLVGERDRGQLELVFDGLALEHPARPQTQSIIMAFAVTERRAGAHDQQLAQITVAHLGDAPEPCLAAGRALAWRQAEEGGELAPAGEVAHVLDRGHDR